MPSYDRLLVASSKGGVGKSTTALCLAAEFARLGKRVLLADLDATSRSLDLLTGCEDRALFTFADLFGDTPPEKIPLVPDDSLPNLSLLPAMTAADARRLARERGTTPAALVREGLEALLGWEDGFDLLVCDTGGGLDAACAIADLFPFTIVVSEQSQTSIRAAEYAAARLERAGAGLLRLCVCSFDLDAVRREKRAGIIEMIDSSALQCVGVVPYDKTLQRAQDMGSLPDRQSRAAAAYRNIARRIMGYSVPLFDGMPALARKTRRAL
ncbi:MAG: P-loop NTPase [Clostridia bacterium]|nr:P-loop NTPase [Clostridia bacterium]